jgi:hypothetical protein
VFGITEDELDGAMAWADANFQVAFGVWDVFYTFDDARNAARSHLRSSADLDVWGVGLHRSLVKDFCMAAAPPPRQPGHAPLGASGVYTTSCVRGAPLADGGTILGHEILIVDFGYTFNSPESRHMVGPERFAEAGIAPNEHGLIDSFDDALSFCRIIEPGLPHEQDLSETTFVPWLIVRYGL